MQKKSIQYKIDLNSKKVFHDFGSFTAIFTGFLKFWICFKKVENRQKRWKRTTTRKKKSNSWLIYNIWMNSIATYAKFKLFFARKSNFHDFYSTIIILAEKLNFHSVFSRKKPEVERRDLSKNMKSDWWYFLKVIYLICFQYIDMKG